MAQKVAIIYNEPVIGRYHSTGEGVAAEEVLSSVASVGKVLDTLGYEYTCIPLFAPLELIENELRKIDVDIVFNLFEGFDGCAESEAAVANILERLNFCFTGSSSTALRVCEDKNIAKQVLRSFGIPTPCWQVLSPTSCNNFNLEFPCIVKPLGEHASHGLSEKSLVENVKTLKEQVNYIGQEYERLSLVEEFLPGREFRVLIVGNENPVIFPLEEIIYTLPADKPRLLTFSAKWIPEHEYYIGSHEKCPVKIEPEIYHIIENIALQSFTALNCRGCVSVDIRQNKSGQPMVIDVNPNTDINAEGGVRLPLKVAGTDYPTFIKQILHLARNQFEKYHLSGSHESETIHTSSLV